MSYIGKILVVMQLVLSICLMAFAAAVSTYQTNWKKKAEDTQKQLQTQQAATQKVEADLKNATDKFNADMKIEQDKGRDLASKVSLLTATVTNLTGINKRQAEELAQRTQIGIDLADDSNARQNEVRLVRINYKAALEDRDKEYKEKAALEDKIFEQNTKLDRLTTQNKALLLENKGFKDVLISRNLPTQLEEYQRAKAVPPKVEGKVVETRKGKQGGTLLTISIGENDGLTIGNELYVYHRGQNPKYLGKAVVRDIEADQAVCEITVPSGQIVKGDDVTTKLN